MAADPGGNGLAPVLMVQGTASSAGKSTLVAGLCRLFARHGVRVAPFKAQNMSNNAAVCEDGGEIGRAQYAQAIAAGIVPTIDMNPVLLKPQEGTCQVVVRGRVRGVQTAAEYFGRRNEELWEIVVESLRTLRQQYDLVIAEGAGSPAEVNLRDRDITNMAVALHANADVLLVGDIDRGGVFAALLGTWEWLSHPERQLIRGFVLNRFRGDPALLVPAPALLEQRTGVPVIGIVPYITELGLAEEDSASLVERRDDRARVEIAVIRLPHLSNFDEFAPLGAEPGVSLRYVTRPEELRAPDLVVLPGTKTTVPDLLWLAHQGLAARIVWLSRTQRTPVLGVCGGFQMLGGEVRDPRGMESTQLEAPGLGLLEMETELGSEKRLRRVSGMVTTQQGFWGCLGGTLIDGYEIHVGLSQGGSYPSLLRLSNAESDGVVDGASDVAGTYVHGLFESKESRQRLISALAGRRGYAWSPVGNPVVDPFDRLADTLATSLRWDRDGFNPDLAAILDGSLA